MFRFFTIFSRIEEKVSNVYDMLLLTVQLLVSERSSLPQESVLSTVDSSIPDPTADLADLSSPEVTVHINLKDAIELLGTNESDYYRHIRFRLICPIKIEGRNVYFKRKAVEELAERKRIFGIDYKLLPTLEDLMKAEQNSELKPGDVENSTPKP